MSKVFIVVERRAYEDDTVMRVFSKYDDAIAYADELTMSIDADLSRLIDYDVFEREVY